MKMWLKCISLAVLAVLLTIGMTACAGGGTPAAPAQPAAYDEAYEPEEAYEPADDVDTAEHANDTAAVGMVASDVQIALVAHSPDSILDDGSFNQGAWDGIERFLTSHGLPSSNANFFQPHSPDDAARIDMIYDAINSGANILILPGFHFESSLYEAQDFFPDTTFVLLDASPTRVEVVDVDGEEERVFHVRIEDNVVAIHYAEEEAGFLAGYAAVMEGHRSLGFMGGIAVPAVVRFGHGFIQGAEHAAASLDLEAGEVTINYLYLGGFAPDAAHATTAQAWFAAGTEVIFAAAGGAGFSVMSGAETAGGLTIGVDVDQSAQNPTVITSAMKALDESVYVMLTDFMNGTFRGGREILFNASIDGVGLPMATSRFQNFTQAQYDAIFEQLASGAVSVSNVVTPTVSEANLDISLVTVNEM